MDERLFLEKISQWVELEPQDPNQENPTIPYRIKCIKPQYQTCGDCGKICQDRTVTLQKFTGGIVKKTCSSCKKCWNPLTDRWDIEPKNFWNKCRSFRNKSQSE